METVTIIDKSHPCGEYVINKEDYDAKIHTLKVAEKLKATKKAE